MDPGPRVVREVLRGLRHPDRHAGEDIPVRPVRDLDTRDASQWPSEPLKPYRYIYSAFGEENPTATAMVPNTTVTNTGGPGTSRSPPTPTSTSSTEAATTPT
ncbi:hypothetical protein ACFCYM_14875 [Streptomyces sp. NPDC056254]|uniref:hypothetical protein n=1 Tax=Streptomyces sp. NPDC056254 TaxID=3345763 RepID=UPI0035D5D554